MNANSLYQTIAFLTLLASTLTAQMRPNQDPVVLKHWTAAPYWHLSESERDAAGLTPHAQDPPDSLAFVGMTPCRVVDTRTGAGFPGAFGPPSLVARASRTFPIQSSASCTIPSIAQAYSFNITVVPSTPTGFITAYPTGQPVPLAATLVWSQGAITSNAAVVTSGTSGSINLFTNSATDIVIDINGYYAATQTTHQIVVPAGINDFTQQFGSPTQGKVSYGTLIPVPCWTLPQAGGSCIIATTVIPPGVTTPTVIVDVQASSAGTASVNLGSTGVAANAAPPSNCIGFNTTQNLTFTAANTMQRFSANINTLGVCGSNPPAVAGAGDILVFRICNQGAAGTLDFSVTSVQFLWK